MRCTKIKIHDFRNICSAEVCFTDHINVFVGDNAQGKTNLLEALFFGTLGKSFREKKKDINLIRFEQNDFQIELEYKADRENARLQKIEIVLSKENKKVIRQNGVLIKRISELVGDFRSVLFCPDHLAMIKEGPSERRDFLDVAISQLYPNYLVALQKFERTLKQRNKLIKDIKEKPEEGIRNDTLDIWSDQLAEWCSVIAWHRWAYIQKINKVVNSIFNDMTSGKENTEIIYSPACAKKEIEVLISDLIQEKKEISTDMDSEFRSGFQEVVRKVYQKQLHENKEREIAAGMTLYGVHRDDMSVYLNQKEAREYASQGQQRSLVLAIKLAEGEISKQTTGEYPLFLFDDVLSELDDKRRRYLLNQIKDKQVIMTTCELGDYVLSDAKVWEVKNGEYMEKTCSYT